MQKTRLPNPYTRAELRGLKRAARPEVWAACVFLRETGLRSAEALAVRVDDLDRPFITVLGKGSKERTVLLSKRARKAAKKLARVPRHATRRGMVLPWTARGLHHVIAEAGLRAGIHAHPHRFRHTHATELVESGTPIDVAADMLGHSSIDTTRIYYQASVVARRRALRRRRWWLRRSR